MKRNLIAAVVCMLALFGAANGEEADNASSPPASGDGPPPRSGGRRAAGFGADASSSRSQFGGAAGAVSDSGERDTRRRYTLNVNVKTEAFTKLQEQFSQHTEEIAKGVPPRELNIEVVPVEKMPLRRADPKLLENKYVARVTFWPAGLDPTDEESQKQFAQRLESFRRMYAQFYGQFNTLRALEVASVQSSPLVNSVIHSSRSQLEALQSHVGSVAYLKHLLEIGADNVRLKADVVDFLKSTDVERDIRMSVIDRMSQGKGWYSGFQWTVEVLAPTAEAAEERARAIVQLVDAGFSRATQQDVLAERKKELDKMQAALAELTKLNDAIEAEEKALAAPSEISTEILAQLKSQKVMTAVEEAGLAARVKACDAMLADGRKLEVSTLQSVSDMKVKAEIERIGLKEKLDQINKLIREGDDRNTRRYNIIQWEAAAMRSDREFRDAHTAANSFIGLFELHAPFQIPGNKITVGPIEWTAPSQE